MFIIKDCKFTILKIPSLTLNFANLLIKIANLPLKIENLRIKIACLPLKIATLRLKIENLPFKIEERVTEDYEITVNVVPLMDILTKSENVFRSTEF